MDEDRVRIFKHMAHEKGLVTISDMEEREPQIYLWQWRYYSIICDAIVNAANNKIARMFCSKS